MQYTVRRDDGTVHGIWLPEYAPDGDRAFQRSMSAAQYELLAEVANALWEISATLKRMRVANQPSAASDASSTPGSADGI